MATPLFHANLKKCRAPIWNRQPICPGTDGDTESHQKRENGQIQKESSPPFPPLQIKCKYRWKIAVIWIRIRSDPYSFVGSDQFQFDMKICSKFYKSILSRRLVRCVHIFVLKGFLLQKPATIWFVGLTVWFVASLKWFKKLSVACSLSLVF